MAAQQIYNNNVVESGIGLDLDSSPIGQKKGTRRFTLNGIEETRDGDNNFISNEKSNYAAVSFPSGFIPIGDRYIEDDTVGVILTNPTTDKTEIGLIGKDDKYVSIVNTGVLGTKITNQCDITYRLRRGNQRVIYWVDGLKKARTFNYDRPHNFHSTAFSDYIQSGGDPITFIGEKWDESSFDLVKGYSSIPFFNSVDIVELGSILPGSYNFAIQLVDADLNPTAWITTSNTVNIFNDSITNSYERIRGSRNVNTDSQSFPRANKSIKLKIGNLDQSFPYYRVAIIRAAGNNGQPEKVFASQLYATSNSNFIYSGNDGELTEIALSDVLIDGEIIFAPQHIEQLENTLVIANGKGKGINWCDLQKYASKIKTDLVYQNVILNSVDSAGNIKNPNSRFRLGGYMPGEVESFGINYLFDDGYIAPTLHIPGKNSSDTTSLMKYYEIEGRYLDVHNCSVDNYWGRDAMGETLVGKKIRHHRFPFRKEVTKPLVATTGSTSNITKYKLKLTITLNPAWTPGPPSYPNDGGTPPSPLLISYTINYKLLGAAGLSTFNGQLTDDDVLTPIDIIVYDDSEQLTFANSPTNTLYALLDGASELATYQGGGNARFIITESYASYVLSSVLNSDTADIFGIEFSNIERPRPDIVGFFITRNERLDEDRLIVDTAIMGLTPTFQQYISFGLLMPKPYYTATNCGRVGVSPKTLVYNNKSLWFFNPEHEFLNKKVDFDSVEIEGRYTETTVNMPTISDTTNSACNGGSAPFPAVTNGGSKGVYINDVQAGTSYNPDVNKKKDRDDDGFDLVLGYRNTNVAYAIDNTSVLPAKKKVIHLSAASYLNFETKTYYNVSTDNKIGMYISEGTLDTGLLHNVGNGKNSLFYGALVKENTTAYSDFMTRPYYKEHNNPIMFGQLNIVNGIKIFNGDAQISALSMVSSVFYDMVVAKRAKKSGLWKIITGAVLLVAGIILAIPSAGVSLGLTAAGAAALSALAISYGVSLAASGIKFQQFRAMIETDYEKGLKDTVTDGGVFETVRDTIQRDDDTIRWFSDRVSNIYMESSVPFGLRSGLTSGTTDFIDSPAPYDEAGFRNYLTEKFTAIDREQGSGRIYKGYGSAEVYDMNPDYMRFNKQKQFSHLAIEYDCCADFKESFPTRWWWSQQSFQEEKIDNYRAFLPNNYRDIEGEHGEITDLHRLGGNLFIHTSEALWKAPQNHQERVTNEIVSFIGTGELFSVPPVKVVDDNLGSAGTRHKWGSIKTKGGIFFISEIESKVYLFTDRLHDISEGISNYLANNLISQLGMQLYSLFKIDYLHGNNPANIGGTGYISVIDTRHNRFIFTKRDYVVTAEKLVGLIVVTTRPIAGNQFCYAIDDGYFYIGSTKILFGNTDYFENKSLTLSYSFNSNKWTSWHSYLPNYYIHTQNNMYSYFVGNNNVWKHGLEGDYGSFYGVRYDFIVERVGIQNPLLDETLEDLVLQTNARVMNNLFKETVDQRYITFDKILIYNSRQSSGELDMIVKDTTLAPNNWYEEQINNVSGAVLITRSGRNWNINGFRDHVIDYTKPMFSMAWNSTKSKYYIDKVVNDSVIDFNKDWSELESFKDKYVIIRLIFNNFNGVNLVLNYSIETKQVADR